MSPLTNCMAFHVPALPTLLFSYPTPLSFLAAGAANTLHAAAPTPTHAPQAPAVNPHRLVHRFGAHTCVHLRTRNAREEAAEAQRGGRVALRLMPVVGTELNRWGW
ncbi:hypothetical protein C8R45DRAFT_1097409 [Mycena sanguinolenta]|nr:hypothetical protein C8R45DRAFT_1097409 [Mycena sanguinolenta]